ncbi:MAG TPA: hypothetical protein VNN17_03720 [Terriglobia bacterium]|nr:hypothetical protein [Terriglobia bacterium]
MRRTLRIALASFLLSATVLLKAQAPPAATIVPFSEAGVTFQKYDPAIAPNFAAFAAANPDVARWLPYADILTNATSKIIVAVTVLWCPPGAPATPSEGDCLTLRQDSLYIATGVAAAPHVRRLVTPADIWPEGLAGNPGEYLSVSNASLRKQAEFLEANPGGRVELDVVILEDGTVLGPDHSKTVELLEARQQAMDIVSKKLLELLDRQQDPAPLLTEYAGSGSDLRDPIAFWCARLAKILLAATNPRAILAELSTLPRINFHR